MDIESIQKDLKDLEMKNKVQALIISNLLNEYKKDGVNIFDELKKGLGNALGGTDLAAATIYLKTLT